MLSVRQHTYAGNNQLVGSLGFCEAIVEQVFEAAIGIEPMNKGLAVRPGPLSPSVMECHRPIFIDLFEEARYSVILKIAPDPPQKSPQSKSTKLINQRVSRPASSRSTSHR